MASIKGKDTEPELTIRKILWMKGYRYRIHNKSMFGKPDISFTKNKLAIFIDGCFWHGCNKCYKTPKTNPEFWHNKIEQNKSRRKIVRQTLKKNNWAILEFWEHDIKQDPLSIVEKIEKFLI